MKDPWYDENDLREQARKLAATFPPLTPEQEATLAVLLRPAVEAAIKRRRADATKRPRKSKARSPDGSKE